MSPEALEVGRSDWEGTILDSQSSSGSSSYHPTASTTEDISSHVPANIHRRLFGSPLHRTSDDLGSSNSLEAQHSDPVKESSGVYVAESPEYRNWSQRSTSVPAKGFTDSTRANFNRASSSAALTRSISDPNSLIDNSQSSTSVVSEVSESRQCIGRSVFRSQISDPIKRSKNQEVHITELLHLSGSYPQVRMPIQLCCCSHYLTLCSRAQDTITKAYGVCYILSSSSQGFPQVLDY